MDTLKKSIVANAILLTGENGPLYDMFKATCLPVALQQAAKALEPQIPATVTVLVAPGLGAAALATAIALLRPSLTVLTIRDPEKSRPDENLLLGLVPTRASTAAFVDDTIINGATFNKAVAMLAEKAPNVKIVCCALLLDAWIPAGSRLIRASGTPVYSALRRHDVGLTRDELSRTKCGPKVPALTKRMHSFKVAEPLDANMPKSNPILLHNRIITADDSHTVRSTTLDGELLWSWCPPPPHRKGVVQNLALQENGTLIVAGYGGMVARLGADGRELWATTVAYAIHSTPVIDKDETIFVACEEFDVVTKQAGGSIVHLSAAGQPLQKYRYSEAYAPARCLLHGRHVLVTANDSILRCLYKTDVERQVWQLTLPGNVRSEMLLVEDVIYLATESGHVMAVSSTSGEVVWQQRVARNFHGTVPMSYAGNVIVCDNNGYAQSLSLATGERQWIAKFRSQVRMRPTPINFECWLFAGRDGDVHAVNPATGVKSAQTRTRVKLLQPGSYNEGKYAYLDANGNVSIWEVNHELYS